MTQSEALIILKTGANVFLTGEPGSGKTHTINEYVQYLHAHGIDPAITASTGIAATHIHGQTIHSWSGIGIKKFLSPYELDTIASNEHVIRRVRKTTVLIIDEVSMLDAATLDAVDQVCREVRQTAEPFGGIQVILVGDFFQLPPVTRGDEKPSFAFRAKAWKSMSPLVCYLTEQYRQDDDAFLALLAAIRRGDWDGTHIGLLEDRMVTEDLIMSDGAELTKLFAHNADVDTINTRALGSIDAPTNRYTMSDKGSAGLVAALKKGCLSPEVLELKIGAIVMCTKNNQQKGYVNGTLGTVTGFESSTKYPIIRTHHGDEITIEPADWAVEDNGKVKAMITQLPLRLAWAITIHKSQGMSLDSALMDLRQVFEYGQGYVALSRVRSLSGLHLAGWNEQTFMVHPEVLAEDETLRAMSESAHNTFSNIPADDLRAMHERFILASGGTIATKKVAGAKKTKKDTVEATYDLVKEGKSIAEIAKERKMVFTTIVGHIEKLVDAGRLGRNDIAHFFSAELLESLPEIERAFATTDATFLTPIREALKNKYSFDQLRIARLAIKSQNR